MKNRHFRQIKILYLVFLLVFFCACQFSSSNCPPDAQVDIWNENKSRAESIIIAIEAYYNDYESWPFDLDTLLTEYLSEMPQTQDLKFFDYERVDGYEYTVCFAICRGKLNGTCCYLGAYEMWDCSYSGEE